MRVAKIELLGKEYPLCFSTRAVKACAEKFGVLENIGNALGGGNEAEMLDNVFWLLSVLIDAGVRYERLMSGAEIDPLTADELMDICDLSDLEKLKDKIFEAMNAGTERAVEVETEKSPKGKTKTKPK